MLFKAIEENNTVVAKWLLSHGVDVDERDAAGRTALMTAAGRTGGSAQVRFLLNQNANVNATDRNGGTPLFYSVASAQADSFRLLLEAGSSYGWEDDSGNTVMHVAAMEGRCDMLEEMGGFSGLAEAADHWGRTPIWYAALRGDFRCYLALKKMGSEIDRNAVVAAVEGGNPDIVGSLIKDGVLNDTEVRNEDGSTLLQIAVTKNNTEAALALIDRGADLNVTDAWGRDLLHLSSFYADERLVSYFIDRFDVDSRDDFNNTPLHSAASGNNTKVLEVLIRNGARTDARNAIGRSPVEIAVEKQRMEALSYLAGLERDIDRVDADGKTLAHIAAQSMAVSSLKFLIDAGANLTIRDKAGNQPVHYVVYDVDTLRTLLEAGIDVETAGSNGRTPLEIAVDSTDMDAAKCLIKYGADPTKVRKSYRPGDNYNSYIKNPSIPTKSSIYELFNKVSKGEIAAKDLDCLRDNCC